MRNTLRRHNDEKKLKQRLNLCRKRYHWRGNTPIEFSNQTLGKLRNGHRSGYRYHSCRCDWCLEGKLHKHLNGNQLADYEDGYTLPRRRKRYFCEEMDVGAKWLMK